jgi:hypothetical protein
MIRVSAKRLPGLDVEEIVHAIYSPGIYSIHAVRPPLYPIAPNGMLA